MFGNGFIVHLTYNLKQLNIRHTVRLYSLLMSPAHVFISLIDKSFIFTMNFINQVPRVKDNASKCLQNNLEDLKHIEFITPKNIPTKYSKVFFFFIVMSKKHLQDFIRSDLKFPVSH